MTDIKPNLIITDLPSPAPSDPLEALSWLGETAEEVAEGLRARGIKGIPTEPSACPLHNYLREWYPHNMVSGTFFYGNAIEDDDWTDLPPIIAEFIEKFDDGEIPDLIEP